MNLDNHKFDIKQEYSDGKYSVHSLTGESGTFKRLACSQESICILPFDLNSHKQIRNVYLTKYHDYLNNSQGLNCMSRTYDSQRFDTYYTAVEECLREELGLSNTFNINDLYYLGQIKHSLPFSKEYKCFGFNLTPYLSDEAGWKSPFSEEDLKNRLKHVEKVKFNKLVKGEVSDSLALSCSLLLLSYFSD